MSFLVLKDLSLELGGKKILNGISLELWPGHIHAVVGPNGAGKSTLAYALMGLEGYRQIGGEIIFKDQVINRLEISERAKLGITLSWQEPARYEGLSVEDFLKAGAKDSSEANLEKVLRRVGLEPQEYLSRAVDKTLSGGERKKIELASIIVMEPQLVLLDEVDSGIDLESLQKIFEIIKQLKQAGATVVLITHSLAVMRQAEHAFLLCNGKVVDKGEVEKICRYFEESCLPCDHPNQPPDPYPVKEVAL